MFYKIYIQTREILLYGNIVIAHVSNVRERIFPGWL